MNTSLCAYETRPFLITLPAIWDTSDPMVQSIQGHGTKHSRSWHKALKVMAQSTQGQHSCQERAPLSGPRKATKLTTNTGNPVVSLHESLVFLNRPLPQIVSDPHNTPVI